MECNYLTIEEAAKRAGGEKFFYNVKKEVIPRLIERGMLYGRGQEEKQLVADDEALARVMRLGVEEFVYNRQSYSFAVVRAPIGQVASKLKTRPGVMEYGERVQALQLRDDLWMTGDPARRHAFLVQTKETPEWSVLIQTVHWFHSCDAIMATALALALSGELKTVSAAAWDDDFSGSSLVVCENGKQTTRLSDAEGEDGWVAFYEFFYTQQIYLPRSYVSDSEGTAALYVADPQQVQRLDRVVLKVPSEVESKVPHVFEKLAIFGEAMAQDLDEETFMTHMQDGILSRAEAILAAGEF